MHNELDSRSRTWPRYPDHRPEPYPATEQCVDSDPLTRPDHSKTHERHFRGGGIDSDRRITFEFEHNGDHRRICDRRQAAFSGAQYAVSRGIACKRILAEAAASPMHCAVALRGYVLNILGKPLSRNLVEVRHHLLRLSPSPCSNNRVTSAIVFPSRGSITWRSQPTMATLPFQSKLTHPASRLYSLKSGLPRTRSGSEFGDGKDSQINNRLLARSPHEQCRAARGETGGTGQD